MFKLKIKNITHLFMTVSIALSALFSVGVVPVMQQAYAAPATYTTSSNQECTDATLKPDDHCKILKYLVDFVNVLSAAVGVIVVIMIAVGGLQYSASRDNPQATAAAKQKIINALIGLLAYLFVYAFLQYIIPGGAL